MVREAVKDAFLDVIGTVLLLGTAFVLVITGTQAVFSSLSPGTVAIGIGVVAVGVYPLFLAVCEQDIEGWQGVFERFGLPTAFERQPRDALEESLLIVLDPRPALEIDHVDSYPVVPRDETVAYMREHYAQFQSALSMLDRMYDDLDLDVADREPDRDRSRIR